MSLVVLAFATPGSAVLAVAMLQLLFARRGDGAAITTWVGAVALLSGAPVGLQWAPWGLASVAVGFAVWRRRRTVRAPGRAGLLTVAVLLGVALHAAADLLTAVPLVGWWAASTVVGVVLLASLLERSHDPRQTRWLGEIGVREGQSRDQGAAPTRSS